jgi:hypothetical protein
MEKNNEDVEANFQVYYHAIRNERRAFLSVIVAVSSRRNGRKSEEQSARCSHYQRHCHHREGKSRMQEVWNM